MSCNKIDLSPEDISAIEEMAGHGYTIEEIAEVVRPGDQCTFLSAYQNKSGNLHQAFRKGFLQSELKLRQRIFLDAQHGSSPAQALAVKILEASRYKSDLE